MEIKIFIICLSIISAKKFYNATEFFEKMRNETPADENLLKEAINNTKEFLKHYIYYKVGTDPPQPDFNKSYFPKIDFSTLFKDIKTKDTNYFDFSREFISEVFKLNDMHTSPYFEKIPLNNYAYFCPIDLITLYDNVTNSAKMYGNLSNLIPYEYFKNSEKVFKTIKNNLNTSIKTINGKNPFTFIQEFSRVNLRNKHSTYSFHQMIYSKVYLSIPVTLEDLANFTVVYENGENFTTDYIIVNTSSNDTNLKFYKSKEDNEKFLTFLTKERKKLNSLLINTNPFFIPMIIKNFDELFMEFEEKYDVTDNKIFLSPTKTEKKVNAIKWKYNYIARDDNKTIVFQCRVDDTNKVNVMKINTCGGVYDSIPSLETAEKCANLFDENEYRIVIIIPNNIGGNPIVIYNIIELLSPYILTRNILRIKKDENMTQFIEFYNSFDLFVEINSTKKVDGNYIKEGFVSETYGDQTEELSKPFVWKVNQTKIEEIKKNFKHKRKPNEIAILTSGFAFSSANILLQNFYKSGAGITIAYNGNPILPDDIFDLGQHSSAVAGLEAFKNIYPEIYEKTKNYSIGLATITCMATYHEFQESHIPQEYDVQIADKRIKIFQAYNDALYQTFIEEAIKVLDYYKENCNLKNKYFVKLSDECIFDNHLHGGFRCGTDSKWNTSDCFPSYCDTGYYYNRISNSCIVYPMENEDNKENTNKENKIWLYIIISIAAALFIFGVMMLIICYKKKLYCFKKIEKNSDTNYNINDDLMPNDDEILE